MGCIIISNVLNLCLLFSFNDIPFSTNKKFLVINLESMKSFPESTRRIKLESIRRKFDKMFRFINNSPICH